MRTLTAVLTLIILLLILVLTSLSVGAYSKVNLGTLVKVLISGNSLSRVESSIVYNRFVRTIAAIIVGVGLSYSGVGLQYVLRNPLAEPYILGLASGAALGVLLVYLINAIYPLYTFLAAFLGALAVFAIILLVTRLVGLNPFSIIIAGVAITYSISSVNIYLVLKLISKIHGMFYWLFGSVAFALDYQVLYSLIPILLCLAWLTLRSAELSTLVLGEEVAKSFGINISRVRLEVIVCSAISTASVVALAGPVGFIGLAAPWMARLMVGSDFRKLLPLTVMFGAIISLIADIAVRITNPLMEPPLTSITSLIATPILIYLLMKRMNWAGSYA